jgi:hypothetical protein
MDGKRLFNVPYMSYVPYMGLFSTSSVSAPMSSPRMASAWRYMVNQCFSYGI